MIHNQSIASQIDKSILAENSAMIDMLDLCVAGWWVDACLCDINMMVKIMNRHFT